MLPSGQPCGGGLVGDDEELLERELLERMAKPICGGTLGKVIRQVLWQVLKLNLENAMWDRLVFTRLCCYTT
uniref:Uncharacterized protein n=1 Tax=Salix viminalis TaxID=40686 RepID=A0A6N2KAS3_SALVM